MFAKQMIGAVSALGLLAASYGIAAAQAPKAVSKSEQASKPKATQGSNDTTKRGGFIIPAVAVVAKPVKDPNVGGPVTKQR